MISRNEFAILATLESGDIYSQRQLAKKAEMSLGLVNKTYHELVERGLIDEFTCTNAGLAELEPYRVNNAVILAAGLSSRFAPISYEKPKGVLIVRGEKLIERQIRQLQEVGITDITVVVGYKKEYFLYLEDEFDVEIVINDEFASRNNHSSLMCVRDRLANTYICSSDNYFTENPFEPYVYQAYYACEFHEGPTREWCISTTHGNRINAVRIGGSDSLIMLGHVFFDRDFSAKMARILEEEYDLPRTADMLWEDLYIEHIKELDMVAREYEPGIINEFDSLDDLRDFDETFLANVDSEVFDNIVTTLGCTRGDIRDIYPLKQGLTNLSCHFRVNDEEYVYRHPGVGTDELINRACETAAQVWARQLGLDQTFIHEDSRTGWKISRFLTDCRQLDPRDTEDLRLAGEVARRLHDSDATVAIDFDFYDESLRYRDLLKSEDVASIPDFTENAEIIDKLHKAFASDGLGKNCLCHNDFFFLNMLIDNNGVLSLIDWEYAGMADFSQDLGTFAVCCELDDDEIEILLEAYFGAPATLEQRRHVYASIAMAGWCWYVWSLYKEAEGDYVGKWLYIYYRYAKKYMKKAIELYGIE